MKKAWKEFNIKWDTKSDIYFLKFTYSFCPVLIAAYLVRMVF